MGWAEPFEDSSYQVLCACPAVGSELSFRLFRGPREWRRWSTPVARQAHNPEDAGAVETGINLFRAPALRALV
jgi:hypothetical protein